MGRARALGPVKLALLLIDAHVVDARFPAPHQPARVELPLFVAVRAIPLARIVATLVLKAHRDAVVMERPQFLDEAVVELLAPLAFEEGDDGGAAGEEI